MSKAPAPDEFAAARASLRDTVKWLVGVASGVGGLLAAGISVTALGKLTGNELYVALTLGLVALAALMLAVSELLKVLLVQPFTERQFAADDDLCRRIAAAEILPVGIATLRQLIDKRDQAAHAVMHAPTDAAKESLAAWQQECRRALDYGAFVDLSNRTWGALKALAMWSVVVILCTAVIGWLLGRPEAGDDAPANGIDLCAGARLTSPAEDAAGDTVQLTLPMDCARRLLLRPVEDG